jgi:hypothetical protein
MTTVHGRAALVWRGDDLYFGQRMPMLRIVPDAIWPGMWRVELPGGGLSDMVNRTRIRDAAVLLALVEPSLEAKETARVAPPMRQIPSDDLRIGSASESASASLPAGAESNKFDRQSYQRDYMRRRRAKRAEASA